MPSTTIVRIPRRRSRGVLSRCCAPGVGGIPEHLFDSVDKLPDPCPATPVLHCHSNFSFLDGASHPHDLVQRAVELGYEALAITDHNGFYGAPRFRIAAAEAGLPTVYGVEIRFSPEGGVRRRREGASDLASSKVAPPPALRATSPSGGGNGSWRLEAGGLEAPLTSSSSLPIRAGMPRCAVGHTGAVPRREGSPRVRPR